MSFILIALTCFIYSDNFKDTDVILCFLEKHYLCYSNSLNPPPFLPLFSICNIIFQYIRFYFHQGLSDHCPTENNSPTILIYLLFTVAETGFRSHVTFFFLATFVVHVSARCRTGFAHAHSESRHIAARSVQRLKRFTCIGS